MWLFLTVPWVGLQLVIVVLPDPTHLHFGLLPVIVVDNIYRNISKNRKWVWSGKYHNHEMQKKTKLVLRKVLFL